MRAASQGESRQAAALGGTGGVQFAPLHRAAEQSRGSVVRGGGYVATTFARTHKELHLKSFGQVEVTGWSTS